jgi:hypothetical protein
MIKKYKHEQGQALVFIVGAMIGLIGIVGLAVDGGMAFSNRRHAQNAADTAAMAASLARVRAGEDSDWKSVAWGVADDNGFDGLLTNDVDVYVCTEEGSSCILPDGANPDDYVQVIITSWFDTFFARVVGIPSVTNRVEAISLADTEDYTPLAMGEAIVALRTDCDDPASFIVQGTSDIVVTGGGLFVNSSDPACGFKCNTSSGTITGNISNVGGSWDLSNFCKDNIDGTTSDVPQNQIDYPISLDDVGLDVPDECFGGLGTYTNLNDPNLAKAWLTANYPGYVDKYDGEPITVIHPGFFNQFPPPKDQGPGNQLNDVMFLEPGDPPDDPEKVYCVGDVLRWNQDKFVLVGRDITIFIREGYDFSLNDGVIDIDAPDSGPYQGYLIIVEPKYTYTDGVVDPTPYACNITGDVQSFYVGTIFAPYCSCTLNGGSDTNVQVDFSAQLLCYEVKINGSSGINLNYDPGENGRGKDPPNIGLTR